jgi:hypothetical protein
LDGSAFGRSEFDGSEFDSSDFDSREFDGSDFDSAFDRTRFDLTALDATRLEVAAVGPERVGGANDAEEGWDRATWMRRARPIRIRAAPVPAGSGERRLWFRGLTCSPAPS